MFTTLLRRLLTLVPVLWAAAINGPLQSNVDSQKRRISDGIKKAFAQSPYLRPVQTAGN